MALGRENFSYQKQQQIKHQNINTQQNNAIGMQQRHRAIAPAPARTISYYTPTTAPYQKRCPTTTYYNGTTLDSNNPAVVRRNARERNRVKQVNNGFLNLRQHIPTAIIADLSNGRRGIGPGANKKLSKVDTLRMAVEYIRRLQNVIDEVDSCDDSSCGSSTISSPPSPASTMSISSSSLLASTSTSGSFYKSQHQQQQQQQYFPLSYAGSFQQQQQQQQQQQMTMISPATSTTSSLCSTDSLYHQQQQQQQQIATMTTEYLLQQQQNIALKFEDSFDDYQHQQQQQNGNDHSLVEDDELLDYISLWQEDV